MANQVVSIEVDGEFRMAELVETKGGWSTILIDGEQRKVRNSAISMNDDEEAIEAFLTDEDEELEDGERGDVFPAGIRETYERGTTEDGANYIDCGDSLAAQLRGASLQHVAKLAEKHCGERTAQGWLDLYTTDRIEAGKNPLNVGMIRMNLGNRIRAAIKRAEEESAEVQADTQAA
jgi:hypothetical protein